MSERGRSVGLHPAAQTKRARVSARLLMGQAWWVRRRAEIVALPTVNWKGQTLYTIRCNGVSGRGPHVVHVTEGRMWHLLSIRDYLCVYHAGDCWAVKKVGEEVLHG
jgi:hypothetical protein